MRINWRKTHAQKFAQAEVTSLPSTDSSQHVTGTLITLRCKVKVILGIRCRCRCLVHVEVVLFGVAFEVRISLSDCVNAMLNIAIDDLDNVLQKLLEPLSDGEAQTMVRQVTNEEMANGVRLHRNYVKANIIDAINSRGAGEVDALCFFSKLCQNQSKKNTRKSSH